MKYINFNNAGSSRPFSGVNSAISNFLEIEERYGGYFATEKHKKKLNSFYNNLSRLINCRNEEISFSSSTTLAWNIFFNSFEISKNQNIIIFENEYGSNLIYYRKQNLNLKIVKINSNGKVCFKDLKKKIDKNTKIVCLCHVASQCGERMEAEKIGKLIHSINPNILFVVDACQSIGQIEVDVKKIDCDVLVGSGRKYLRGPRGTGFIFIKNSIRKNLQPLILDLRNTKLTKKGLKVSKANIFENFEYSPALKIGLSKAIEKINLFGIKKIEFDIAKKSKYLRKKLEYFNDISFFENKECLTGINTLRIRGYSTYQLYQYLLSKKILTSISSYSSSSLYFKKKLVNDVLRISLHQYNTFNEINYLIKCLIDLIKK